MKPVGKDRRPRRSRSFRFDAVDVHGTPGPVMGDTEFESVTSTMSTWRSIAKPRDLRGFREAVVHYNTGNGILVDQVVDQRINRAPISKAQLGTVTK